MGSDHLDHHGLQRHTNAEPERDNCRVTYTNAVSNRVSDTNTNTNPHTNHNSNPDADSSAGGTGAQPLDPDERSDGC
jgi:hypothetical protein